MKYEEISQQEAWNIMKKETGALVLDVRTPEEFAGGHIKGAVNVPLDEIEQGGVSRLPDKNRETLVYCRSGARSRAACGKLAEMGYTAVRDFGGIITWPYGIVGQNG